jgi:hypothetical protein
MRSTTGRGSRSIVTGRKKKYANQTLTPAQMRSLLQSSALQQPSGSGYNAGSGCRLIRRIPP